MSVAVLAEVNAAAAPLKPRVRADSLPESTRYRDDGCDVHPSCLSCPLPRCRYEEPGGLRALLNEYRDRQMVQLRLQGMGVDELADRFSVSKRTVFRVLGSNGLSASNGRQPAERGHRHTKPVPLRRKAERNTNRTHREVQCA